MYKFTWKNDVHVVYTENLKKCHGLGHFNLGYNFKALSCEATHLSPQFPFLSIENFLLLTYRLNK